MTAALKQVFYPDCVEEWIEVNFSGRISKLEEILEKANGQLKYEAKTKDSLLNNNDS